MRRLLQALRVRPRNPAAITWAVFIVAFASLSALTAWTALRLWWVPSWYLAATAPADIPRVINEYRLALGPVFVGMMQALGGAAILYGLWLNSREHAFTRLQHRAQRLKDATAQLESPHPSTRVAAVHEFEAIASESSADVPRIIETLRPYIRDRAAPPDPDQPERPRQLPDDVLPAISVLTRLSNAEPAAERLTAAIRLDLRGADLRHLPLGDWIHQARLEGANLSGHRFSWPSFRRFSVGRAVMREVVFDSQVWHPKLTLPAADPFEGFGSSDLTGARFTNCAINDLNFKTARLDGATFENCHITSCDFTDASMVNVRFRKGSFDAFNVKNADMEGTTFEGTAVRYPERFAACDRRPAGE